LKLQYGEPLSNFGFNFNLRRYTLAPELLVGRCRLTVPKPELKARLVSALETKI
jgi:hypothetical protein